MPQITLPSSASIYDLYERLVAASLGVTTDKTTEALTSILPRTCRRRRMEMPDVAANAGASIACTGQLTDTKIEVGDISDEITVGNFVPVLGVKLQGSANNVVLDVTIEVA